MTIIRSKNQSGQTLIETLVAIFVLTTALVSGLALAIKSLSSSGLSQNQIIASNLAREGIEVVRMMRDTNWLETDAKGSNNDVLQICDNSNYYCFPNWLKGAGGSPYHNYDISQSNPSRWILLFNQGTSNWFTLSTGGSFNLYLQNDGTYTPTVNGNSMFARRIVVNYNTSSPYTNSNPEIVVQSTVGWRGRGCNWSGDDPTASGVPGKCKVTVEEHMTNWKDYR